ncbi:MULTISPECIES: hypothetical protein [Sinorhizobium]|uniref:hypothetical protein n=1 Tax=Sinorhizobium TaxID=28105 RepID=UPI000BE810D9|nr:MULTISPECIES: hypothetical protein [Sinorhizobium]PDT50824.1 hypothetical protein CO664_23935 [Sinorhizobium sp. NG07B]POH24945.1 hypothetical protein ATY30_28250 [Sinorhizobium americanum]
MSKAAKSKAKSVKTTEAKSIDLKSTELDQEEQARREESGAVCGGDTAIYCFVTWNKLEFTSYCESNGGDGWGKHGLGKKGLKLGRLGPKLW